ncbi:MAG: protein kinase [Verrucomicrobiales bacterium]|nr:protein kinase [Verrucomicrobiales bacterium]
MQSWLPAFEFLSLIGRGGMGVVYQARQLSLNRLVAIKILPADLIGNSESDFAARFRLEATTLAKLSHPGIVSVFDSGETHDLLYIVMEYVDGTDVARMVQAKGKLPPADALEMLKQVCEAMEYAHQNGIVHRDLKPANLLITRQGRVKIADFGLAKHHDETLLGLTKTNVAIGTPEFLAPEAWTPGIQLDRRADLYSIGVTLYQMLTGEVPRGLWRMPSVKVGTDPRFDAILDRAMQPEREMRYQSCLELQRDLHQIETEPRIAEPPPTPVRQLPPAAEEARPSNPVPTSRRPIWLAAFILPTLLVVVVVLLLINQPAKEATNRTSNTSTNAPPARSEPTLHDAAFWLVREGAEVTVVSQGQEFTVSDEAEIPADDFQIQRLVFDRWRSVAEPPPPEKDFKVLRAIKTLRHAYLRLPGVTDGSLTFLAHNPELRSVTISGSDRVTDQVLPFLAELKHLEFLCISHAPKLTGRDFAKAAWLKTVRHVDFLNASLDDETIRILSTCPRLRTARLEGTGITAEGLRALSTAPGLLELSVGYCQNLSEEDFVDVLPEMPRLRKLELVNAPIGNQAAGAIATLTNLVDLHLSATRIDDRGLARLASLSQLENIALPRTRVTAEGIAEFKRALPRCKIAR